MTEPCPACSGRGCYLCEPPDETGAGPTPTEAEVAEYDREQADREQRMADRWSDPSVTDLCAPPFGDARP